MSAELLARFERGDIEAGGFSHRMHVEVAAELLAQAEFLDAAQRYQRGIEGLANRAGVADKANLTITLAFLSLIAERRRDHPGTSAQLADDPLLARRDALERWYSRERLASPLARRQFLMPDR